MKVCLNWLAEFVDLELPASDIANLLTMAGVEVKEVEKVGEDWEKVVVGEIKNISPHPHADRLKLVEVNLGQEAMTVVCGAPNLRLGSKVPFAHVGAKIIDPYTNKTTILDKAKIRGIMSYGMICSEKELGISENHEGIMELPPQAKVGGALSSYIGDTILDLDVTPNRPDLLSLIGVAREIAALTGKRIHYPHTEQEEGKGLSEVSVDIISPELCPRYCCAEIHGFEVAPSPLWMKQRLSSCGVRPISNIVDITNYVMLEYGQPLHAFDLQKIRGKKIIVRPAKNGETLTTLDGKPRELSPEILVIADEYGAVAIAGIMGGEESGIGEETTSLLLESANFNPQAIRRGSKILNLRTEASLRFEKGLPETTAPEALLYAQNLMRSIAGGKISKIVDAYYPQTEEKKPIFFPLPEIERLSGIKVKPDKVKDILSSLEIQFEEERGALKAYPPPWRKDLNLPCDLVEEVCRIQGYDNVPALSLSAPLPHHQPQPIFGLKERVKDILASHGMQEVITYSLVSEEKLQSFPSPLISHVEPLKVRNPLTRDQEYLRTTLLPSLFSVLNLNQRQGSSRVSLFEVGKVYLPQRAGLPEGREFVSGLLWGHRHPLSWLSPEERFDFFDIKGIVEGLMERLGAEIEFARGDEENILPEAKVIAQQEVIGILGEIHPQVREKFDLLPGAVLVFEVDLRKLLPHLQQRKYYPLPRFPAAIRDISLLLSQEVPANKVKNIIQHFPLVSEVTLFDMYTGKGIPKGRKSLSFRIMYQSPSRTLNDDEIRKAEDNIIHSLEKEVGAVLRGSEG
jgi:phenylalanyl-tRNA synthetase beta chain